MEASIFPSSTSVQEIVRGTDLGFRNHNRYVFQPCADCGKERWVMLKRIAEPNEVRCRSCSLRNKFGSESHRWRGGIITTWHGYRQIFLYRDDFFYGMTNKDGYVMEHRLVMAKHLGRNLHSWEIVHHLNGIKDDNRLENLQLVSDDRHKQITILENRIKTLERRVTLLEAENMLLRTREARFLSRN